MDIYRSGDYTISEKTDQSPVTEADLLSHRYITRNLKTLFPGIPIISEESSLKGFGERSSYEYVWLLDPLDGTKEFIHKTDEFSINLALIHHGEAIGGFIYLPVFESFYHAIKGSGSWMVKEGVSSKLQSSTFSLKEQGLRVVASRSNPDTLTQSYIDALVSPSIVNLGSALKFISIASGDADYYPRMVAIMEWDTAAGQVLIEEAGGSLRDVTTSQPLRYNKSHMKNPYFIASGKIIDG
jgi:3'(2'), 5'-bisphosphate nucleotidase